MKLMIKQKLIIFSALLILVPLLLSAMLIVYIVNSNIENQSALSIEKDARVAEQLYRNRQLSIVQAAQNTAQAISSQNLLEAIQSPANLQGDNKVTGRINSDIRNRLTELIEASKQSNTIDFVVITDSRGSILMPQNEGSIKDNPLFIGLQNAALAKKTDAQSSSMRETAESLRVLGSEALSKQAEVKSEG